MKRTYQPNNRKKAKKHGFFARIKGNVLNKRRAKKRKRRAPEASPRFKSAPQAAFIIYFPQKAYRQRSL